jgi:magnesium-transporting ATPase (P-type)
MNNNSRIDYENDDFKRVGEPTEAALKVLAEKLYGNPTSVESAFNFDKACKGRLNVIAELDFTSKRKAMSMVVSGYKN